MTTSTFSRPWGALRVAARLGAGAVGLGVSSQLMTEARTRVEQEVSRLGGQYAHVLSESIDTRRNDATGEAWLHGTFAYVLLGLAAAIPHPK